MLDDWVLLDNDVLDDWVLLDDLVVLEVCALTDDEEVVHLPNALWHPVPQ